MHWNGRQISLCNRSVTICYQVSKVSQQTANIYVATFQQHLHMEYTSLSWYDIPELVVPIRISLIEGCWIQGNDWLKGSSWLSWSHHFESFAVPPWHGRPLWNINVTNDQGCVPLVVSISRSFPYSWPITGFETKFTRRVPLVEQSTWVHLRFLVGFVLLDL
jgi:hypothetical protein